MVAYKIGLFSGPPYNPGFVVCTNNADLLADLLADGDLNCTRLRVLLPLNKDCILVALFVCFFLSFLAFFNAFLVFFLALYPLNND